MSSDNDWVKLEKSNDWGSFYYRLAGVRREYANKSGQKVLHAFDQIEIRWPDGTEEVVSVTTKSFLETVSDMGHRYNVHNVLPVIVSNHHGIEVLIEFDQVEIRRRCLTGPGLIEPDPDDDPDEEEMCA